MIAYKLLNPDLTSHNGCQWTVGEWKKTSGKGDLCGSGWLHAYEHAEIAHFMNPAHANFESPVLWTVEVGGTQKRDGQRKSGWTKMRLLEPHPLSEPTTEQRIRFAFACSLSVYSDTAYRKWAVEWINGADRSSAAAYAAADAAADAAAYAAAYAAACVAYAADAACAAYAAAYAAYAAADAAADAAAYAAADAAYAACANPSFSLVACAKWAYSNSTDIEEVSRCTPATR